MLREYMISLGYNDEQVKKIINLNVMKGGIRDETKTFKYF